MKTPFTPTISSLQSAAAATDLQGSVASATAALMGWNSNTGGLQKAATGVAALQSVSALANLAKQASWATPLGVVTNATAMGVDAWNILDKLSSDKEVTATDWLSLAANTSAFIGSVAANFALDAALVASAPVGAAIAATTVVLGGASVVFTAMALAQSSNQETVDMVKDILGSLASPFQQVAALAGDAFSAVNNYVGEVLEFQAGSGNSDAWLSTGLSALVGGSNDYAMGTLLTDSPPVQSGNMTYLGNYSAAQLVTMAQSNPAVAAALEALSPYAYPNDTPAVPVSEKSLQQLSDRAAFLLATLATATPPVEYRDLQSNTTLGASWLFTKPIVSFASSAGGLLEGGTDSDHLYGSTGNDTLDGKGGGDWMEGGRGDDVYHVRHIDDHIVELADGGNDTVILHEGSSGTGLYVLPENIEVGVLAEGSDVTYLKGNSQGNWLYGNSGNNTLEGGAGFNVLSGGLGDDTYILHGNDTVLESANGGYDTVNAFLNNYQVAPGIERVRMYGTQGSTFAMATGSDGGEEISLEGSLTGVLYGGGGDDILRAGTGWAYLNGGSGRDKLYGGASNDTLNGLDDGEFDELYGGGGADQIYADGDYVKGGQGDDLLIGGDHGSTFVWEIGDGLDTLYAGPNDTVQFDGQGQYSVTASFNGNDMVLSTGTGAGVVIKNWRGYGGNTATVVLPDGFQVSGASLNAVLHPAITGWSYSGGTFAGTASNLSNVVQSFNSMFTTCENSWFNLAGYSLFQDTWNTGLLYGADTGRTHAGKTVYSWGTTLSMSLPGLTNNYDPYQFIWADLSYDFWQNDAGGYEFAINSASTGYGGQNVGHYDEALQQWVYEQQPHYTVYSSSYSHTAVELAPAVNSVVLYDPTSSVTASRGSSQEELYMADSSKAEDGLQASVPTLDSYDSEVVAGRPSSGNSTKEYTFDTGWVRHGAAPGSYLDAVVLTQEQPMPGAANLQTRVSVMPVTTNEFRLVA